VHILAQPGGSALAGRAGLADIPAEAIGSFVLGKTAVEDRLASEGVHSLAVSRQVLEGRCKPGLEMAEALEALVHTPVELAGTG